MRQLIGEEKRTGVFFKTFSSITETFYRNMIANEAF